MNYKLFLNILLVLTIIFTICICVIKPQMHKSVLVYNSDFEIVMNDDVETYTQDLPTMELTTSTKPQAVKVVTYEDSQVDNVQKVQTKIIKNDIKTQQVTYTNQTKPVQVKVQQQQPQTTKTSAATNTVKQVQVNTPSKQVTVNTPQLDVVKTVNEPQKIVQTTQKPVSAPQPATVKTTTRAPMPNNVVSQVPPVQTVKPVQTHSKPETVQYLTEKEEEIAWNIWRSNLQNKIMKDVKLPYVPNGTIFRFSFTVDKYGKITNVQTRSDDSRYTPYAIQYIAPVIRSYQGREILNFPKGSRRVVTEAHGAWKMSNNTIYSTPQDYNDVERISR